MVVGIKVGVPQSSKPRSVLVKFCLTIKMCLLFSPVHQVLGKVLEPPAQEGVSSAVIRLQDVGALYEGNLQYYFAIPCRVNTSAIITIY